MGPSPYLWFLHVLGFKLLYDNEHISKTLQRTEKPKVTRGKENSRSPLPVYHMIPLHHSPHSELVNAVNKACWPVYPASWTCNLLTYNWRLWRNSLWRWRRCRSRVVRWMFKWGWHLHFTMGRFETVEGDGVLSAIDVNGVVLVSSFKHLIRPIVRLLQRFPNSVMPDEYMCARRYDITDIVIPLGWCAHWCRSQLLHSTLQSCNIANWVGQFLLLCWWENSPWRRKLVTYTKSAAVQWISSLSAVRMPRSSMGSASVQRSGLGWAFRDAFNCPWNRSISPFVIGWYDVVRVRLEPKSCISFLHSTDSNWRPRSVVAVDGVPNLDIHPLTNALATVSAVMSTIGMASGHLVNRSMQVRMYV